jgi:UDP-GlcNAc:undecaprenyl-phosphate GlcNAc-1-phosphate transferase
MPINYFFIIFSGFALSTLLVYALKQFSLKKHLLIKQGIPFSAGIGMGLAFICASMVGSMLFKCAAQKSSGIIIASGIMLVFGLIDDFRELSIFHKFLFEIIAATCLILFGVRTNIIYLGNALNIAVTFIWVIAIANAINHLDVMDGVASGISLIAGISFFVISLLVNDIQSMVLSLSLIAAILGFLIYNFPPAKIYMGNSGSHFLGFVLAAIALNISYADLGREIALLSPLLILGFPIFDTVFLIVVRTAQGKSALRKIDDHLALRFIKLGYSKRKTLLLMLGLSLFFSSAGIMLSRVSNIFGIMIIAFLALVSLALVKKMGFNNA